MTTASKQPQAIQVKKTKKFSCPPEGHSQWDWHPKVYLPIEKTGRIVCPYCNTEYYWEGCKDAPLTQVFD